MRPVIPFLRYQNEFSESKENKNKMALWWSKGRLFTACHITQYQLIPIKLDSTQRSALLIKLTNAHIFLFIHISNYIPLYVWQTNRDTAFPTTRLHMRPAKAQISLHIRAIWSFSGHWGGGGGGSQGSKASSGGQRILWSACANAQADLCLRIWHMHSCRKSVFWL